MHLHRCRCIELAETEASIRHELCKLADIPAAGSRIVPFFGREVQAYRQGGRIRAVGNVCLHLGGPLDCKDGKFVCPWHNAAFDMASGERIDGPALKGAKLMVLPTRVDGDSLLYAWGE